MGDTDGQIAPSKQSGAAVPALIWKPPIPLGEAEVVRGLGGIVAPLLAGFSLAAIATLLTATSPPRLTEFAIVAFVLTVAVLLFAMQFAFVALRYVVLPSDRIDWHPEASTKSEVLKKVREEQAVDQAITKIYADRTALLYNLGLVFFSAGLTLLLVPTRWTVGRILALAIAAVATSLELYWISGRWLEKYNWFLKAYKLFLPVREDIKDRAEMSDAISPVAMDKNEAISLLRAK
jgi:hypothetical protein